MRKKVPFLIALVVAFVLMLCFRAMAFTIYSIDGDGLRPRLFKGDHVLVNRWSYGLRVGTDGGLFSYGRIGRRPVSRGDVVAFERPGSSDEVLICRCKALPGDTVCVDGQTFCVPGVNDCADTDYFWMEALGDGNAIDSRQLGLIPERQIIGRVVMVVYSHNPDQPFWKGWRYYRMLLPL